MRPTSKLTREAVENITRACLFTEEEVRFLEQGKVPDNAIVVHSILLQIAFNADRIESSKDEIMNLLLELDDSFMKSKGGGTSFLQACNDKYGNLWTGEHRVMDTLVALGMAIDKVVFLLPRDAWLSLPGGMPYIQVVDNDE